MNTTRGRRRAKTGSRFVLYGLSWKGYTRVLRAFEERRLRITYDRGALEIMTRSFEHESWSELLGRVVVSLTEGLTKPIRCGGSTTIQKRRRQCGLEPDKCFWIANEAPARHTLQFDLPDVPAPDLAIDVDIPRASLNRMKIYAALGVPEVWRYDETGLSFHVLSAKKKYEEAPESLSFPGLKPADLLPFLALSTQIEENALTEQFRQWVRQKFADKSA